MSALSLPLKLLLAIVLGGMVGLERESASEAKENNSYKGDPWGLRTYALVSLLGAIAGLLSLYKNTTLSIIIIISFFIFMFLYYGIGGWMIKSMGLTSELGAVFSFLIGYFVTSEIFPIQLIIAITIVIELILSIKEKSRTFILGIKKPEIDAFIGFAIISLVILPFLPNKPYHLTDFTFLSSMLSAYNIDLSVLKNVEIINPFRLWFIVALITGIDVFGYVLSKIAGKKKSIILTSAIGGLISSTAITQSLAIKSNKLTHINELVSAAIFSGMISYLQVLILIAPLNSNWLLRMTPLVGVMMAASFIAGLVFYLKDRKKMMIINENHDTMHAEYTEEIKIFSFKPAIKFALLLIVVRFITKTALSLFGNNGFLISSVLASFTGIDAVVINLSELAGKATTIAGSLITLESAGFTFICVNAVNLLSKTLFAFTQAKREFTIKFFAASLFIVLISVAAYYIIYL